MPENFHADDEFGSSLLSILDELRAMCGRYEALESGHLMETLDLIGADWEAPRLPE
jgi:hypothetical protein